MSLIEAEIVSFQKWVMRRKRPGYAERAARAVGRMLRELGTVDPTVEQVENWFAQFANGPALNRTGKVVAERRKNGYVRVMGAYIKLYSAFRQAHGRPNGFGEFVDEVLPQFENDDSERLSPLTREERKRIIATAETAGDHEFSLYLALLYEIGARATEVLAIADSHGRVNGLWKHLSVSERTILLPRTKRQYNAKAFVSGKLMTKLAALRAARQAENDDPIFLNRAETDNPRYRSNEALSYWTAARLLKKYATRAGITRRVHLHLMKSARITDLFEAGATIEMVSKLTRTSPRTLMRYFRPSDQSVLETMDRLNTTIEEA